MRYDSAGIFTAKFAKIRRRKRIAPSSTEGGTGGGITLWEINATTDRVTSVVFVTIFENAFAHNDGVKKNKTRSRAHTTNVLDRTGTTVEADYTLLLHVSSGTGTAAAATAANRGAAGGCSWYRAAAAAAGSWKKKSGGVVEGSGGGGETRRRQVCV